MINVAFVCHCDKKHGKVIVDGDVSVQFIDPWSGCKKWKEIEDNSLDVIYTIGCPVYLMFDEQFNKNKYPKAYREILQEYMEGKEAVIKEIRDGGDEDTKEIMDSLFEDGFEKLKQGGKLVFPYNMYRTSQNPTNFVNFVQKQYPSLEFSTDVTTSVPYEYLITWDSDYGREGGHPKPEDSKTSIL